MSTSIKINGTGYNSIENALSIKEKVNERSTASFVLVTDVEADVRFKKRQAVEITDGSEVLFTGFVDVLVEKSESKDRFHSITCIDNHYLADKLIFAGAYENKTIKEVLQDIHTKKLASEGITYTDESIDGAEDILLTSHIIDWKRIDLALDVLAERSGCDWWIDKDRLLWFKKLSERPVGKTLDEGIILNGSLKIKSDSNLFRNRQITKGGQGVTNMRTDTTIADGEQTSFKVNYPIAFKPTIKVNGVPVAESLLGINGVDNANSSIKWFWSSGSQIVSFNSISNTPIAGTVIDITYQGYFDTVIISQNDASIVSLGDSETSTGIVETVDTVANTTDLSEVIAGADSKLKKYSKDNSSIKFQTLETGFTAGDVIVVNIPSEGMNVDENYLVQEVAIKEQYPLIIFTVTLVKGFVHKSWEKAFTPVEVDSAIEASAEDYVILPTNYVHSWEASERPNPMMVCKVGTGVKVGTPEACPTYPISQRAKLLRVYDVNGSLIGEVLATHTTPAEETHYTVFIAQKNECVGVWQTIKIFAGENYELCTHTITDIREKTNFDEVQIHVNDYKTW